MSSQSSRISISFNKNETDLFTFINNQQNASLSLRVLCKKWIAEHGTSDVIESLAITSTGASPTHPNLSTGTADQDWENDFDDL